MTPSSPARCEWFEPGERFSSAEVFALLREQVQSRLSPDEVGEALDRLSGKEGSGLSRLHTRHAPMWDRLYTREALPAEG